MFTHWLKYLKFVPPFTMTNFGPKISINSLICSFIITNCFFHSLTFYSTKITFAEIRVKVLVSPYLSLIFVDFVVNKD